jgi:hypothetical protein
MPFWVLKGSGHYIINMNCKNSISYLDFQNYLDSGEWDLCIGINDRMTIDEHLSYIERITTFEDAQIEFILDDIVPKLAERIDVFINPTVRETDMSSDTKHIQFKKIKKQML